MIPKQSILYISINVDHEHPLRNVVVEHMDPLPDLDLNRITSLVGEHIKPYFRPVIDGTISPLPTDLKGINGIVVGCSGHSVNLDKGSLKPWQTKLIDFVRNAILEHDIPYLGLCGGGQVGLVALGGKVKSNPPDVGTFSSDIGAMVIGATRLELTSQGRKDSIFDGCPNEMTMTAIHADYLADLPLENKCEVLANGTNLCNQVVGYKEKVRLFGVHPEISQEFLDRTMAPILNEGGFSVADRQDVENAFHNINPTSNDNKKIIENFIMKICKKHYHETQDLHAGITA